MNRATTVLGKLKVPTLTSNGLSQRLSLFCQRIDCTGSATNRKPGSGRPKTARTPANIAAVDDLICSQEDQPGTSRSTRQLAQELGISASSVRNIAKAVLHLQPFKRIPAQVINPATQKKPLDRCRNLLTRLKGSAWKKVFFTNEKVFYFDPPMNTQNDRVWASSRKRDIASQRLFH